MDTYCVGGSEIDVCRMFDQYLYKRTENLDVALSVSNGYHSNGYSSMSDQTFHTPSFGDEEFDIPPINPAPASSASALPSNINYQHSPMSMGMRQTSETMSSLGEHSSNYQQTMYSMSAPQEHINMNMRNGYGGQQQQQQAHSNGYNPLHMMQHSYSMGPPSTVHQATSPTQPHVPHETTSEDSDDSTPHSHMVAGMKRPSPEPAENGLLKIQKKPKAQKKKKKRDPNEPQKPVSAYALFFRDTQAAIKGQNPNASFGEVSKIVASMWDSLDADHKNVYKKKTEAAKKDYLKALAAYRASLVSKGGNEAETSVYTGYGGYGGGYNGYSPPPGLPSPPMSSPSQQSHHKKPMMPDSRQAQQSQQVMMGNHMSQNQQQHMTSQQHMSSQQQHMSSQQPPPQQSPNQSNSYLQQQQQWMWCYRAGGRGTTQ